MAKNTTENQAASPATSEAFDWKAQIPAEYRDRATEVRITGGLIPMWIPNLALDNGEKDFVLKGYVDRFVYLPVLNEGKESEFEPLMLLFWLSEAFDHARVKTAEGIHKKIRVEKDGPIYVPMNKNLQFNRDLITAAGDRKNAVFAMMRVVGREKTKNWPTPMTRIEVVMIGNPPVSKPREGALALPLDVVLSVGGKDVSELPNGQQYNNATGEVLEGRALTA